MEFNWDSANIEHIARHDVEPEEAEQVVRNRPIDLDGVLRNGEERTLHLGETDAGRVLFVVITERAGMHRVVTSRPATRNERAFYFQHKDTTNDKDSTDP
jgi:uncharacterized DUF497 family protein